MSAALPALRAGAVALLNARGQRDLAALVARSELSLAGSGERWSMGAREVTALRLSLLVDAHDFEALRQDATRLSAVTDAFTSAVRTPETELADLAPVLRLPGLQGGWHEAYRHAAPPSLPERPAPEAVLRGAAALLAASGQARATAVLERAAIEAAPVADGSMVPLMRYVVRLDPADLAAVERDAELGERLRRAVHAAGTRAAEAVASVELSTALSDFRRGATPDARLAAALEARGALVVAVSRCDEEVVLAVVSGGEVRLVRLTATPGDEIAWRAEPIASASVPARRVATAEQAHAVAALLGARDR